MSALFVKLDVSYHQDPKMLDLDDERAELLFVRGLTYCKTHLTDGVIHRRALASFAPFADQIAPAELAAMLVATGVWREHPKGWIVPAWLDHNKPAAEVMTSAKGRELAHKRHHVNKGVVSPDCDFCQSANGQVNADGCEDDAVRNAEPQCATALPETETETETTPQQSQSDPVPEPPEPVAAVVDDQQIRRTAVLVGKALAVGADNPAAYAAGITKRILTGDDPTDRDEIRQALTDGQTPEQIAEQWSPDPPAGRPTGTTDEITQAEIRARASERHAAAKARQEEITQAEPARPEAVREILATTRRHRTGATT